MGKHAEEPFHMLMGGGDQLYCDGVIRELELQDWVRMTKQGGKKNHQSTDEILFAICLRLIDITSTTTARCFGAGCLRRRTLACEFVLLSEGVGADSGCHRPMLNMCGKCTSPFSCR